VVVEKDVVDDADDVVVEGNHDVDDERSGIPLPLSRNPFPHRRGRVVVENNDGSLVQVRAETYSNG
jgi:hypothetical protein